MKKIAQVPLPHNNDHWQSGEKEAISGRSGLLGNHYLSHEFMQAACNSSCDVQVARMGEGAGLVLPAQPFRELSSRQIWRRRRGPGTSDQGCIIFVISV